MSIEVGSKLQGKVTGITNFGAFVELPNGKTGLVHISEIANNYVKDIHEHLKVGEQVIVKVIQVENNGKIGLSIKKAQDRPDVSHAFRRAGKSFAGNSAAEKISFEDKLSRFLKDSEERLSTLKRQTDSKRGGRGSKRG